MSIYENNAQNLIKKRNDAKQLIEHTEIRLNESEKLVELQTKLAESGKENTFAFEKSQLAKIQLELRRAKELLNKINDEIETQNLSANIKFNSGTNFNAKTIEEAIQEAINNGLIEKENKNFDRINESIYTNKFNSFLQEIKGLDWENETEYIKLISDYFSEFLKHNKEIERLKFLAIENDRFKKIAKDQKEAEEKSPLLEIAVKLTGYGGYNLHTTTQPVFYFIKDVLKEYKLNPTEAIDIINDMQGSFNPQFNTNTTPKIISYLKEIPKEFYTKKQPPTDTEVKPKGINNFNKLNIDIVQKYFMQLAENQSKNEISFLTKEEVKTFIDRAFRGNNNAKKVTINVSKGEKTMVWRLFYDFYNDCTMNSEFEGTKKDTKGKYVRLLTDNITNWEYQEVFNNFSKSDSKYWKKIKDFTQ
jgi:hypothetical protein